MRQGGREFERLCRALHDRQELVLELMTCGPPTLDESILEALVLARYQAMQARTVLARTKCETDLCWALARLIAVLESHADLSAESRLVAVTEELSRVENRAAAATVAYNRCVERLCVALENPLNRGIVTVLGMTVVPPFELDPKVARESMMVLMSRESLDATPSMPVGSIAFAT